jgi:RAB protein geranylgeranyltransferase component A
MQLVIPVSTNKLVIHFSENDYYNKNLHSYARKTWQKPIKSVGCELT